MIKQLFTVAVLILIWPANAAAQTNAATREADSLFQHLNYKDALVKYKQYVNSNPSAAPVTYARMGYSFHKMKKYDDALKTYQLVQSKNPAAALRPFLYSRMAMTYAMKKDKNNALIFLDSANANSYSNLFEMEKASDYDFIRNEIRFKEIHELARLRALPCLSIPGAREFDFWIGEWEVYNNQFPYQMVGINVVESVSGGCTLLENWSVYNNVGSGKSFNYYDTISKKWTQLWIGSGGGQQFYTDGEYKEGAMRFKYKATGSQNQAVTGNFIFYKLGPNKVRQYQEFSTDGGKTHQVSYDFIYIRKGFKKD